jgi:hypothetical protein
VSVWLRIDTDPPVALYRDRAALAHIDCAVAYPALVSIGTLRRPLSRPNFEPGASANMVARCDNADGRLSAEFAVPPLRTPATVMDDAEAIFAGLVTDCDLSAAASITIEAGQRQPLSMPVPLRSSSVWGSYDTARPLPIVYGRASLSPVQYSQDRRLWLVADHPIQGVDRVSRDDVATAAWAWRHATDSTGHAVAIIELQEPLAEGERLAVALRGRMHPVTGALLVRPDEVLWDFLADVCGVAVTLADLDAFRAETDGIEIGGVIADPTHTVRAQVDAMLASVGAAWSAAMPGIAIAWPPTHDTVAADAIIDRLTATDLQPVASEAHLATVLRVLYDYDWAAGKHRQALELRATDVIKDIGEIVAEIDAGWLHSARLADALGRAHLAWSARPTWTVSWRGAWATNLPPGAWVDMDHPLSPVSGRHRLIQADLDMDRGSLAMAIQAPAGPVPVISSARLSTAFEPVIQAGAAVVYQDGVAVFSLQTETGQPLPGAVATLDGGARRIADGAGRVSFPASRGAHELRVDAAGYQPMIIGVVL